MLTYDDVGQAALSFLVAQASYIEPGVYRTKYPDLNYADFVPVDTSAPAWVKSITFFSIDTVGQANWFNHMAKDVPLADIDRKKYEHGVEMAAIGYGYTVEELQQAMMVTPNIGLTSERANAARRGYEEMCHNVAMYGDPRKNWTGLTNSTVPAVINITSTWASRLSGATPTPTSILQDVNAVLTGIWQSSLTVEMANTLLLPLSVMTLLSMTQLPNTTMNLLEWIKKNNVYSNETGGDLLIRGVRGLDTAGATGNGRIIAYDRTPDVLKMHRPMSHQFLEVWRTGPLRYDIPGIFRLAGLEIRRPGAIRYIDGVC
jgi:hypothetical protein